MRGQIQGAGLTGEGKRKGGMPARRWSRAFSQTGEGMASPAPPAQNPPSCFSKGEACGLASDLPGPITPFGGPSLHPRPAPASPAWSCPITVSASSRFHLQVMV